MINNYREIKLKIFVRKHSNFRTEFLISTEFGTNAFCMCPQKKINIQQRGSKVDIDAKCLRCLEKKTNLKENEQCHIFALEI
jgi:hypothetical protein